jgi:queuine/archaeosine tRNA-ribosyltransferase
MTPHADAPADLIRTRCTRSYQLARGHTTDDTSAWRERTRLTDDVDVDVTMMYAAAHAAFTRDLRRLAAASERGTAATSAALGGWAMLTKQPKIHHTAEDTGGSSAEDEHDSVVAR